MTEPERVEDAIINARLELSRIADLLGRLTQVRSQNEYMPETFWQVMRASLCSLFGEVQFIRAMMPGPNGDRGQCCRCDAEDEHVPHAGHEKRSEVDQLIDRIRAAAGVDSDAGLSRFLGLSHGAVHHWREKGAVPDDLVVNLIVRLAARKPQEVDDVTSDPA